MGLAPGGTYPGGLEPGAAAGDFLTPGSGVYPGGGSGKSLAFAPSANLNFGWTSAFFGGGGDTGCKSGDDGCLTDKRFAGGGGLFLGGATGLGFFASALRCPEDELLSGVGSPWSPLGVPGGVGVLCITTLPKVRSPEGFFEAVAPGGFVAAVAPGGFMAAVAPGGFVTAVAPGDFMVPGGFMAAVTPGDFIGPGGLAVDNFASPGGFVVIIVGAFPISSPWVFLTKLPGFFGSVAAFFLATEGLPGGFLTADPPPGLTATLRLAPFDGLGGGNLGSIVAAALLVAPVAFLTTFLPSFIFLAFFTK